MPEEIMHTWRSAGAGAKPVARYETSASRKVREAFNHDQVRKNTFLKGCSTEFVDQVVAELQVALFTEGDEIVKEGESADVAYFLNVGKVEVLAGPERQTVKQLSEGSVFGEVALFQKNHKRTATVRALEFCDCRAINHNVFQKILLQFPKDKVRLQSWSSTRLEELNKIKESRPRERSNSLWRTVVKSARNIIDRRSSWPVSPKFGSESESNKEAVRENSGTPKETQQADETETKQIPSQSDLTKSGHEEGLLSAETDGVSAQDSNASPRIVGAPYVVRVSVPELSTHLPESHSHLPVDAKANSDEERRKVREAQDSLTTISTASLQTDTQSDGSLSSDEDTELRTGFGQRSAQPKRSQELPPLDHSPKPPEKPDVPRRSSRPMASMPASLSFQGCDSVRSTTSTNCGQLLSTWRRSGRTASGASINSAGRPQLPPPIRRPISRTTEAEGQFPHCDRRPVRRRSCLAAIVPQADDVGHGRKHRRHSDDADMMRIIKAVEEARLPSLRERGVPARSQRSRERCWTGSGSLSSREASRTSTMEHLSAQALMLEGEPPCASA